MLGANYATTPTAPPIAAARNSTGQRAEPIRGPKRANDGAVVRDYEQDVQAIRAGQQDWSGWPNRKP
jgi:hypothetical protein